MDDTFDDIFPGLDPPQVQTAFPLLDSHADDHVMSGIDEHLEHSVSSSSVLSTLGHVPANSPTSSSTVSTPPLPIS